MQEFRVVSQEQFEQQSHEILEENEAVLVTSSRARSAKLVIPVEQLPLDYRRTLFDQVTSRTRAELAEQGLTEEDVIAAFYAARDTNG